MTLSIIHRPILVRRAALVVARGARASLVQTAATVIAEMDLRDSLRASYPLPPPDATDPIDGRGSWSPDDRPPGASGGGAVAVNDQS